MKIIPFEPDWNLLEMQSGDAPSTPLYHYTNLAGLGGILKEKKLWMTSYKDLNDPSEVEHGKNFIVSQLEDIIKKSPQLYPSVFKSSAVSFFEQIMKEYSAYLLSFCKEDYLPAWRYYGDNGAGFSIGFREEFFQKIGKPFIVYEVFYEIKKYKQYAKTLLDKLNTEKDNYNQGQELLNQLNKFVAALILKLPKYKNNDFESEREWRICATKFQKEDKSYPSKFPNEESRSGSGDVGTERHCCLKDEYYSERKRLMIKLPFEYADINQIYCGPKVDIEKVKRWLRVESIIDGHEVEGLIIKLKESTKAYR